MAAGTAQETQNFVTLKGSVELIVDFFNYSLNSILYQRGVFPEESFIPTQHYGLTMYMSKMPEIKKYTDEILPHLKKWLTEGKIKKLVLALCDVNSKEPLECWEFRILAEETPTGEIKQQGTKPLKDIQQEIRNVLRQITACVTFLPLLDCVCAITIVKENFDTKPYGQSRRSEQTIPDSAYTLVVAEGRRDSNFENLHIVTVTEAPTLQQSKWIGRWLGTCAGMCFGAVVIGGLTRLTESGLSMVEWSAFGERPPLSQEDWEREFEKYKQFPEYKQLKKGINLEEFKFIWHMEYGHRMWGRLIGAMFVIPAAIFWKKGYFNSALKKRILIYGTLIGCQGLLGWYMVKSGLEDRFHGEADIPRVSQYRLASHLGSAFVLYSLFLWTSLHHLIPANMMEVSKAAIKFKRLVHFSKGIVFLTAISGAFVAGLDAGLVYNSYPLMAGRLIPEDWLALSPAIRNFTENPSTVQFDHRTLGHFTVLLLSTVWLISRRIVLPTRARYAANALAAMAWMQASLGIATLLFYVPTPLASSHQAGSLVLLSTALWLSHELKNMKYIPK
uniref:EOG090X04TT n=1 Tax=Daphnia similis TaxID=35528 RepID=A0A4Y7LPY8_9CRUS|nr:EOG090X04TT [Daphnia similis]SVE70997.1 EOG090X04TT [Daphnia similis]SVE71628.1 EOG090X04TT [Daphnia similis]SVE72260.1 EOG090X04TT [Daphnia similis]